MDTTEKVDQLLSAGSLISLSFSEYSARFVLDETEDDFPDDGIDIEVEPRVRLRWAFNEEAQQIMIRAAIRLETPIIEIVAETRAEYAFPGGLIEDGAEERENLHLFVCNVADRDLHPNLRNAVQDLSLKLIHTSIMLPLGSPFSEAHRHKRAVTTNE